MIPADRYLLNRRDFLRLLMVGGGGFLTACNSAHFNTGSPQVSSAEIQKKIDTVIVLLQENHSFDSLYAGFPGANGNPAPQTCPDILKHTIPEKETHTNYDCSYTEPQVPNYWKLAKNFSLCDNYYSDVFGPSFPNYLMLTCAQSPVTTDPAPPVKCPHFCFDLTSMVSRLDAKGITWHDYGGLFANIKSLEGRPEITIGKMGNFLEDTAAGKLPHVTWIGTFLAGGRSDSGHPPASICGAENFAVSMINAVMASPQWSKMLLILTWDEWGGFYDHVNPPIVERLADGKPFRYGHRVPCLVISPYTRAGYVEHQELSHVSTLRTIEAIFDLQPLTDRDANANSLLDCLDLNQVPISPLKLTARNCST